MKKIIKIITPLLAVLFLLTACAGEKTKAAYNSIKTSIDQENKDIDGLSYTIEKKDGKVVITWDLDFTKINFEKDKDRLHFKKSSLDEERKLSYIEENLKKNGAVEKK